jgi:hypothetical protein
MDARLMERARCLVGELEAALFSSNARTVQDMIFYIRKLEEKVKNQKDRIRVLEGPTNHAGGLKAD